MDGRSSSNGDRRAQRNLPRNIENLQLTEEERKVLKECRLNSMIRGVPAGLVSALITKFAINTGKFPHLAHWSRFYYGVTFTGGLLFGIASYRRTCLEEIMKLENSVLADQVREFYKKSGMEHNLPVAQKRESAFQEMPRTEYNSSFEDYSNIRNESTSEDSNKFQNAIEWPEEKADVAKNTSFEERRKQNRDHWQRDRFPGRFGKPAHYRGTVEENKSKEKNEPEGSTGITRLNKYGDPIE